MSLSNARTPPATVNFVLSDAESDTSDVEITYACHSKDPAQSQGEISHMERLATSPSGTSYSVPWDYGKTLGGGLTTGVTISVKTAGGEPVLLPELEVGNDPPVVTEAHVPQGKVVGIARVDFKVRDSSGDSVKIRAEYHLPGVDPEDPNDPAVGWHAARPSGSPLEGILAPPEGKELNFFWDVVHDLQSSAREVVLRFTADDGVAAGAPFITEQFLVDNNTRPVVSILAQDFVQNPDRRRGIPIRFDVADENGDDVLVVFQWRLANQQSFPALPGDRIGIEAILRSPKERRKLQICSERSRSFEGDVALVDPALDPDSMKLRLPELGSTASPLLARGIEGREVEVLRGFSAPRAMGRGGDLRSPVAAIPVGDGTSAAVLERPAPGSWRLREVDLWSGKAVKEIASGSEGDPSALAAEPGDQSFLAALDQGGAWKILRLDAAGGDKTLLFTSGPGDESGPVRGLLALGSATALATVGSSLLRLDTSSPAEARAAVVLKGLKTPWGIALDPLRPGRIYLAERDWQGAGAPGRIQAIELDTHARRTLTSKGPAIERPESLAVERSGTRLLMVTDRGGDGAKELSGIDLAGGVAGESFEVSAGLPGTVGAISTGPEGLRVLALPATDDLAVGGGVEARRTITGFKMLRKEATVDRKFEPRLEPLTRWRIKDRFRPLRPDPKGTRARFVWDSEDVAPAGDVVIRATPFDTEMGTPDDTSTPRPVDGRMGVISTTLGGGSVTDTPQFIIAADVDEDGAPDLISANVGDLTLFRQDSKGSFSGAPTVLGPLDGPKAMVAADLDGDGLLEIASANSSGDNLTVFHQKSAGVFEGLQLILNGMAGPKAILAADLDGDGSLDLISANERGNNLTVFVQSKSGEFKSGPVLGGSQVTRKPGAIAVADLDGDGDLDVVSANQGGNNLVVFFQETSGTFQAGAAPLASPGQPVWVTAADLNGDGKLDLISANASDGTLLRFIQRNQGEFEALEAISGLQSPRSVAVVDLDGDGRDDLIVLEADADRVAVFLQSDSASFSPKADLFLATGHRPLAMAVSDLNGDGRLDIAIANALESDLTVLLRKGTRSFNSVPDLSIGVPSSHFFTCFVRAGDLDGDGELDLAAATGNGNTLAAVLQRSQGVFETLPSLQGLNYPKTFVFEDLDGDGMLDIASQNFNTNDVAVFYQESPGVFRSPPDRLATLNSNVPILAADLDGDGLPDLVSGTSFNLDIFFQRHSRTFEPALMLPLVDAPNGTVGMVAADLDGDGQLDLVSANGSGQNLLNIFFQRREGTFSEALTRGGALPAGEPTTIVAADLNGDGRLDLATRGPRIFFQRGPGEFGALADLTLDSGTGTTSTLAVDLDGDGANDLVSAEFQTNAIKIFFQKAPGGFSHEADQVLGGVEGPYSVLAGDLDGDGDLDLVLGSGQEQRLMVFFANH